MEIRRALPVLLAVSMLVAWLGAGCTRPAPPAVLRIHLSAEPISLDPSLAEDGVSMKVIHNLMEGLVGYDERGTLEPRLAQSWRFTSDGLHLSFTLQPGAHWSDGKPVSPDDFVTAIRRAVTPATAARTAALFDPIRGARLIRSGKASPETLGIRSARDQAGSYLEIDLERRAPWLVHALTLTAALPQRADVLQANDGRWPEQGPVTGAYRIVTHERDRRILLERTDLEPDTGACRQIELVIVPDENTAANLFDQGKLDVLSKVPVLESERYRKSGALRVDPYVATYYVAFNTRRAPFDQVSWRRAVAGSIHKDEVVSALGGGTGQSARSPEAPARSWIPRGLEGGEPFAPVASHLEAARALSGKGAKITPVVAGFDSGSRNSIVMEKIQHDVTAASGLKLRLEHRDWKSYVQWLQSDPPAMYRFGWLAPFLDPITHLQVFTTGNPNNYTGWSNPAYDRLVEEISSLAPGAARDQKIHEAQVLLVEREAVVVPIYHYVQTHAVSKRVSGFAVNPFGVVRFSRLRL